MAGITTNGIGSGLDINNLVGQLVEAEVTPTRERLDREEATVLARISAFGLIKSALSDLNTQARGMATPTDYRAGTVSSSDEEVLTVTSTSGGASGNFSIDVKRLAENHRLVTQDGVSSASAKMGTGTLSISVGGDVFDIEIDSSNDSLGGIRDAINDATDNTGVGATIIKVDDGAGGQTSKLVLTARESGESSRISVSVTDSDGNDSDGSGLSRLSSAQLVDRSPVDLDSLIEVDGETVTSSSNVIDDVIEGLSFTLVAADPGNPVIIKSGEDRSGAVEKVSALVASFNDVLQVLRDVTVADPESGQSGALVGDASARFMESRLRAAIGDEVASVQSVFGSLASVGVTTGENGQMELDAAALEQALARDFDGVVSLFTASDGAIARLRGDLNQYLDFQGVLDSRTEGLNERVSGITERRTALATRESALEARYLAQFSAMDSLVASLQATGDFLTQQLDALNKSN